MLCKRLELEYRSLVDGPVFGPTMTKSLVNNIACAAIKWLRGGIHIGRPSHKMSVLRCVLFSGVSNSHVTNQLGWPNESSAHLPLWKIGESEPRWFKSVVVVCTVT